MLWWLWGQPREVQIRRASALGGFAIPLLVIPFIGNYAVRFIFEYVRYSPTVVFPDALRLTRLVPYMDTKDISNYSFPGDHAFILTAILLFYLYMGARRCAIASATLAVVFSLPRLVSGAHWFSDTVIGGMVPALLVMAWIFATPFGYHLTNLVVPLVRRIYDWLPQWLRPPVGAG